MRYLGLDIGDRWVGVALSDPSGMLATPFAILERSEESADLETIVSIIKQHDVRQVIVGLPRSMDGTLGRQVEKVEDFTRKLRQLTEVPVEFRDERLTTKSARQLMRASQTRKNQKKRRDDAIAAAILLQSFLDEEHGELP